MLDRTYLKPGGTPGWGVKGLAAAMVAALGTFVFWGSARYPDTLGLVPARALEGLELWRLVSAPLWLGSLAEVRIAPLVLSLFCFFTLGSPLERWLGTRRFLILVVTSLLVGHLGGALIGLALSPSEALGGPAPGAWAVVTALGINYWNHPVHVIRPLPIRGRHLFWGLAIGLIIAFLLDWKDGRSLLPFASDLLGGIVGALFVTRGWRLWQRRAKVRSRFVLLKGGGEPLRGPHPPVGRKGNGKGTLKPPPKGWN